jgi:hypothetical protein
MIIGWTVRNSVEEFLVNTTNRCTEFQFYWYYYSTCFGFPSAHHQEFLAVHRLWYILCSCDEPFATLVANGSSQLQKMYQSWYTAKNSWWWAERQPETCRVVIPIKLGFSSSVDFIRNESVTMHGHTIIQKSRRNLWRSAWGTIPVFAWRTWKNNRISQSGQSLCRGLNWEPPKSKATDLPQCSLWSFLLIISETLRRVIRAFPPYTISLQTSAFRNNSRF